jgi:hypothetical protein
MGQVSANDLKLAPALLIVSSTFEQVPRRAREPVEPSHDYDVTRLQRFEHLRQLRPVAARAGDLFLKHVGAAGRCIAVLVAVSEAPTAPLANPGTGAALGRLNSALASAGNRA